MHEASSYGCICKVITRILGALSRAQLESSCLHSNQVGYSLQSHPEGYRCVYRDSSNWESTCTLHSVASLPSLASCVLWCNAMWSQGLPSEKIKRQAHPDGRRPSCCSPLLSGLRNTDDIIVELFSASEYT